MIGNIRAVSRLACRSFLSPVSASPPHDSADNPFSAAHYRHIARENHREMTVGEQDDATR